MKKIELNLISKAEALDILAIDEESFDSLVEQGVLYPFNTLGEALYLLEDVYYVKHRITSFRAKGIDLINILNRVDYLERKVSELQTQMELLLSFFGLSTKSLGGVAVDNLQELLRILYKHIHTNKINEIELTQAIDALLGMNHSQLKLLNLIMGIKQPAQYIIDLLDALEERFTDTGIELKIRLAKKHLEYYKNLDDKEDNK